MSNITWCPKCPEIVTKSDDGTWRCTGCGTRWNANRQLSVTPIPPLPAVPGTKENPE